MRKLMLFCFAVCISTTAMADKSILLNNLSKVIPGVSEKDIVSTPIVGLYQVTIGARIIYVSDDGRYIVQGEMVDLSTRENMTDNALKTIRKTTLSTLDESEMIIFPAKNEKHKITVFSDIDCGYCRKLHSELSSYTDAGITVRYLSFPRSGVNTESYYKAVSVWCAKDRNQALTDAKLHNKVIKKSCNNPIKKQMALGEEFGVTGTPTIITDSGTMIPGYVPASELVKHLN